ncbi:MAG: hypothetical protein AB7Q27_07305 [Acidimicrobiia bacterium]
MEREVNAQVDNVRSLMLFGAGIAAAMAAIGVAADTARYLYVAALFAYATSMGAGSFGLWRDTRTTSSAMMLDDLKVRLEDAQDDDQEIVDAIEDLVDNRVILAEDVSEVLEGMTNPALLQAATLAVGIALSIVSVAMA